MKRIVATISAVFYLLVVSPVAFSQGELDEQPKILMRNEQTFGIFLNSNGIGGDFQYARRINARNHTLYRIALMNVKHPKEIKISNGIVSNKSFVFGKTNSFFALKAQLGHQSELYRKNDAGGISIRYFYEAGPTLGLLKPIYYQILYSNSQDNFSVVEKFNSSIHQTQIIGKASFFQGIREISLVPGASARVGFTFEYSRMDVVYHALEFGIGMDIYPKKIPIMETELNNFYFMNLFVGYRFGKVIDMSDAARSKSWLEKFRDEMKKQKETRQQRKSSQEQPDY